MFKQIFFKVLLLGFIISFSSLAIGEETEETLDTVTSKEAWDITTFSDQQVDPDLHQVCLNRCKKMSFYRGGQAAFNLCQSRCPKEESSDDDICGPGYDFVGNDCIPKEK